ncbi:ABC transporter ATP-binding protein [Algiphilus sp.]|uniref:ABC transporter ATP-binding protein n=1 Tax=Algiphilus sp. TaxID=1872431 RepID=UPI0025C68ED4|nr:oligopeptide/dipeptide ABC transporter ATP-binding protein [Algiphilus sp.]MCK5771283.1 ATP-binding cassette domain-containing protein [Algiphilus sp.]
MDAAQPARLGPAGPPVLTARKLRVVYGDRRELRRGAGLVAVDDVSFDIAPGESVAVVGESGCGKSSLARTLAGLQAPRVGSLLVGGEQVGSPRAWRRKRRAVQMVFQDPASSLDPRMRVEQLLDEPLRALRPDLDRRQRHTRIHAMLEQVGLQPEHGQRYPHSFSGGQAQRIAIARALVVEPDLLICDEPLSALDVSVQAQIINLLQDLRERTGMAMLVIAHDLAVVRQLCDRVLVMYLGKVVEQGATADVLAAPAHPYTRALLSCVPRLDARRDEQILLEGELPDPRERPTGCVFRTRCPLADGICAERAPDWHRQEHGGYSACHFAARHASPMVTRALR